MREPNPNHLPHQETSQAGKDEQEVEDGFGHLNFVHGFHTLIEAEPKGRPDVNHHAANQATQYQR